jgi:hypothetical protein
MSATKTRLLVPLAALAFAPGCHIRAVGAGAGVDGPVDASFDASPPVGTCNAVEQEHAIEGYTHVADCSPVTYQTKPPSSGNHYANWAAYKTYASPVPEGFWVHDLEHGAIVLSYNCPDGCQTDVELAQAMLDSLPADPVCTQAGEGVHRRSILLPDPNLDVRFAASAWGWTLRADCFDDAPFRDFALRHYEQGREDLCNQGLDVSAGLAPGCGGTP